MADDTMRFPEGWADAVAQARARALVARGTAALESGEWTARQLRDRIAAEERRLTPPQRSILWMAVVADAHLAELCERSPC